MNPVMLEHLSKVENQQRARQIEEIQRLNRASAGARPARLSLAGPISHLGKIVFEGLKTARHWLARRQIGMFGVGGKS